MRVLQIIIAVTMLAITAGANASVTCSGKITEIVKWSGSEDLSILIENTGRYIKFQDKTAISMALHAYASQKSVTVFLNLDTANSCQDGWPHYTVHVGYLKVSG